MLYKSILEHTKILNDLTNTCYNKSLTFRIKFLKDFNCDLEKIKCKKCGIIIFRNGYCKKHAPKYPSDEFFIFKYGDAWKDEKRKTMLKIPLQDQTNRRKSTLKYIEKNGNTQTRLDKK